MTDVKKDIKKLTLTELKKQSKQLDATEEFFVTIGESEYKLTHDVVFRKTKQHALLEDMLKFFNSIEGHNVDWLEMASPYTALLIIKHFTSLEVPNDVDKALDMLTVMIDLDAITPILNVLPEDETNKIFELLKQTVENIKSNVEEAEKEAMELADQISNEELKEMIEGNDGE
ncbi:hypothetical protein Q7A53_06185 [Halobacillus rhizosphaerae]|uniref:hypothetical protein n=1 Tax=Halobacillus rhizosphaerae TaxID=3064889 RepID=UPI00398AB485